MKTPFSLKIFFILALSLITINSYSQNNKTNRSYQLSAQKNIGFDGFADIVEELLPTVVNISSSQDSSYKSIIEEEYGINSSRSFDKKDIDTRAKISSIGSGFLISADGYIVTNGHVIEDSNDINVNLFDGSKYKAKIIGIDKKTDLALLKISTNKELKFARFGDSNKARIGDWTIVIGNPYGLGGSVSTGIISARGRDINNGQLDDFIQTDASINKGNSGGPLFNIKGEVIGISSSIFSPSGGSVGIGFATPSSNAIQIIRQLRDIGEVSRGWIGISVQDVTDDLADSLRLERVRGAFVSDVANGGPSDKAGIIPTDIIIKFDEQDVEDMRSLPKIVAKTPIGKYVKVHIWRQGKIKILNLMIERAKEDEKIEIKKTENRSIDKKPMVNPQFLGLTLNEYRSNNIEGLVINDITPKSEAFDKGLISGDIILSVNQIPVNSIDGFKEIIRDASQKNKKAFLFVKRNENNFAVVLNLK